MRALLAVVDGLDLEAIHSAGPQSLDCVLLFGCEERGGVLLQPFDEVPHLQYKKTAFVKNSSAL